jgi:hypothetical protein
MLYASLAPVCQRLQLDNLIGQLSTSRGEGRCDFAPSIGSDPARCPARQTAF